MEKHRVEYPWLYCLADANGNFELNLRVIYGKVAAIRPSLSLQDLTEIFIDFHDNGLLFTWTESGNIYGHWTGCEAPGLLPSEQHKKRYGKLGVKRVFFANDPEVQAYIQECMARPVAQTEMWAFTSSFHVTSQTSEAEECENIWRKFWQLYPKDRIGSESTTHEIFLALGGKINCQRALDLLADWMASDDWDDGSAPPATVFLQDEQYRTPPAGANGHARRQEPKFATSELGPILPRPPEVQAKITKIYEEQLKKGRSG